MKVPAAARRRVMHSQRLKVARSGVPAGVAPVLPEAEAISPRTAPFVPCEAVSHWRAPRRAKRRKAAIPRRAAVARPLGVCYGVARDSTEKAVRAGQEIGVASE